MSTRLKEWNVLSMLEWATAYFEKKDVPDPRHSIEWLLAETLQVKRLDLYLQFDRPLSQEELDQLRPMVKRRADHEPLQYIIGYTDFMNARIEVNTNVLIPRIETEQLVEMILDDYPHTDNTCLSVMDIGTGSGCIPVTLKMERPSWNISGMDISMEALDVARKNATINNVDIHWKEGDIFHLPGTASDLSLDLIISNPPYVKPEEKKQLERQVVSYEPPLALFCDDPNTMYGHIISFAEKRLTSDGCLYLEIHELYATQTLALFDPSLWKASILKDYEKKSRFIIARKHSRTENS